MGKHSFAMLQLCNTAFKHNITVYDAYFLSLASLLKFVCITADEKLYNKVKSSGLVVLLKDVEIN